MENLYGEQLDERAAEIAWHWEGAGERSVAARWHARAAVWVEKRDLREAMRHWRSAYGLLPELREQHADADLLIHLCQRMPFFGGISFGQSGKESSALFERGMRAAEHHGDIGAQVRLSLSLSNADSLLTRGRLAEFLQSARQNVRLARESGDAALCTESYLNLAIAEGFVGNVGECERALDEFFRSARVADDSTGWFAPAIAYGWRGTALQYGGHLQEAAEAFARAQELAATADPLTFVLIGATVIDFGLGRGELPEALELAARMSKVAEEFGAANLPVSARSSLARARALRGEWKEAALLFEEALALANEHNVYLENEGAELSYLSRVYLELGDLERARETAERALVLVREQGSKIYELQNVLALAHSEVALGHDDAVDPLLARAEALLTATGAWALRADVAEIRAEGARRRRDQAGWRAELEEAQRLFAETGATGHVARALQEHDP
jgi:tetratricopeptide (TPR) repeat protein